MVVVAAVFWSGEKEVGDREASTQVGLPLRGDDWVAFSLTYDFTCPGDTPSLGLGSLHIWMVDVVVIWATPISVKICFYSYGASRADWGVGV